ncbi:MAG: alpha/beta-hydrolase family protein [Candidatus Nanopelagicales bacterium]
MAFLDQRSLDALDHSGRAALLLSAVASGRSYQPNLLTRNTVDQAVITGVSAAAGYGLGISAHSMLASSARRFSGGQANAKALAAVDATAAVAGLGVVAALKWQEHESGKRAFGRLVAGGIAAAGTAGLASIGLGMVLKGRGMGLPMLAASAVAGAGSWLATRPRGQAPGSLVAPGTFFEDDVREVSPVKAGAIGVGVTLMSFSLARGEAALSKAFARSASFVLGGSPAEHRTLGRVGATAATYGLGWLAVTTVAAKLTRGGEGIEPAHATPPDTPEVTGSPASGVPWDTLSREGRRWLSMALTPAGIDAVMGTSGAKQPIRVYASEAGSASTYERAAALLAEIDRTHALDRKVFALFSPTGSGYVNYVADETLEYLTGGDCASAAIQYSVLPSSLSLTKVGAGTDQTRMVLEGLSKRLAEREAQDRPIFLLFGESLGSQVSEEMFRGTYTFGLEGSGFDSAIWIGTPDATEWRREIWGQRTVAQVPEVGPGAIYLPRAIRDWKALPAEERAKVRYLLLQNGDDPIPKFGAEVVWRRPAWLGPQDRRPPGSPRGTSWTPVTTFFATFLDMLNALTPTPGVFAEGGHDYRDVLPDVISEVWQLPRTADQRERMEWALRLRERAWEINRRWAAANAKSGDDCEQARQEVLTTLGKWRGEGPSSEEDLEELLRVGLQPEPPATGELPAYPRGAAHAGHFPHDHAG